MGYGDYTPSSGNHPKKPLTKAQLQKIQEAYNKVESITHEIQLKENNEQKDLEKEIRDTLNLFL